MGISESQDFPETAFVVTACPVCLSHAFRRIHFKGKIPLVECDNCGLHIQQPQPSDARLNEIYGANYFIRFPDNEQLDNHVGKLKNGTARLQLEDLRAYSSAKQQRDLTGLRLLEIGPGHGYMLQEARRYGLEITGLEYSVHATQMANKNLGADYVQTGTLETSVPDLGTFDVIVLSDVIEHVRDPRRLLFQVFNLLKPGGMIFIATISTKSLTARFLGPYWVEYKPEHLFYFNEINIVTLLGTVGFEETRVTSGRKVMSWSYIAAHFEIFRVPILTPLISLSLRVLPTKIARMQFKTVPSGFNVVARRPLEP
jgi:SAM-dependent methyltransferase